MTKKFKSRILIDFNFYKIINDLHMFEAVQCCENALYSVAEGELCFAPELH